MSCFPPASYLAQLLLLLVAATFGTLASAQSCGGRGQEPCIVNGRARCNQDFRLNAKSNRCVPCNNGIGNPCPGFCGAEGEECCLEEDPGFCDPGLTCTAGTEEGGICQVAAPECTAVDTSACTGGDTCTDVVCNADGECDTTPTACTGANQMFDVSAAACCVCADGFANTSMDGGLDCTSSCVDVYEDCVERADCCAGTCEADDVCICLPLSPTSSQCFLGDVGDVGDS